MSSLKEFLIEAENQRFEQACQQGRIPPEELAGRVRFVGDPRSPLAVPYHFATVQEWIDYYENYRVDTSRLPEPPPPLPKRT